MSGSFCWALCSEPVSISASIQFHDTLINNKQLTWKSLFFRVVLRPSSSLALCCPLTHTIMRGNPCRENSRKVLSNSSCCNAMSNYHLKKSAIMVNKYTLVGRGPSKSVDSVSQSLSGKTFLCKGAWSVEFLSIFVNSFPPYFTSESIFHWNYSKVPFVGNSQYSVLQILGYELFLYPYEPRFQNTKVNLSTF